MENEFLQRMRKMAKEAGEIAREHIEDSDPSLKTDQSVLTKADIAISSYIKSSLSDLLKTKEHILIDEEDSNNNQFFKQEYLESAPYLWIVDPIDGTRAFSNQMPLFGISIAVLKNLKPWLGVVYLPILDEFYFSDGQCSYFVKKAFTSEAITNKIVPVDQDITKQSVFFGSDVFLKEFNWDYSFCQIMLPSCAVIDLCWPALGRGCGCFFHAHLWDFAGAWPICHSAGLFLRNLKTGKVLDRIHVDLFQGQDNRTWRLKENHILSSERNFSLIQKRITDRIDKE